MSSTLVRQAAFLGGEIAPLVQGRTDTPHYQTGLRTALNFIPTPEGALVNRPGTKKVAISSTQVGGGIPPRLIPFRFSDGQNFILEVGDRYACFYQNGGPVLDGTGNPYTLATPWAIADVMRLKFSQDGDVITFVCVNGATQYPPYEVARLSNTNWTVTQVSFTPQAYFGGAAGGWPNTIPQLQFDTTRAGGSNTAAWSNVVAYQAGQYAMEISGTVYYCFLNTAGVGATPSADPTHWIAAVDSAHPGKTTFYSITMLWKDVNGVTHETGDNNAVGMGNFVCYTDRPATLQWFATDPLTTAFYGPGGALFPFTVLGFNIYKGDVLTRGLIASVGPSSLTYTDNGSTPDFGTQPPKGQNPFDVATGTNTKTQSYPGTVSHHEQRIVYARSNKRPTDFWGSAIGKPKLFDINTPVGQSDSYNFKPASERIEEIRSMLSLRHLLLFTGQGEWNAYGASGSITASSIVLRRSSRYGSGYLDPLAIGQSALFVTARGRVRDLVWDWRSDMYQGRDLSAVARHLVENHSIVDWAYAETPNSIVWAVREDGVLLSLTYDAQGAAGFARHTTQGRFMRVATVVETDPVTGATEDAVYVVVRRVIQSLDRGAFAGYYIERFSSRVIPNLTTTAADGEITSTPDVRPCNFLDSALTYDGRNAISAIKISDASVAPQVPWAGGSTVSILYVGAASPITDPSTGAARGFQLSDIGSYVVVDSEGLAGGPVEILITGVTSALQATGTLQENLPANFQSVQLNAALGAQTITGLYHLNGLSVNVLADGAVAGPFVVAFGSIALGTPAVIATVGLPYNSDMELLDMGQEQIKTNVKEAKRVTFEVVASRGLLVGETFDKALRPAVLQKVSDGNAVPPLTTGNADVYINASWNQGARACLRQSDPLPLTVVAAVREVVAGGR